MKMRLLLLVCGLIVTAETTIACEVCKKQQPEVLRSFAHGAGPQSNWDYVLVVIMIIVSVTSLILAVRSVVRPGERDPGHIKRSIFNYD